MCQVFMTCQNEQLIINLAKTKDDRLNFNIKSSTIVLQSLCNINGLNPSRRLESFTIQNKLMRTVSWKIKADKLKQHSTTIIYQKENYFNTANGKCEAAQKHIIFSMQV